MDGGKNLHSKKKKNPLQYLQGGRSANFGEIFDAIHSQYSRFQRIAIGCISQLQNTAAIKTALSQYLPNNFSKKVLL